MRGQKFWKIRKVTRKSCQHLKERKKVYNHFSATIVKMRALAFVSCKYTAEYAPVQIVYIDTCIAGTFFNCKFQFLSQVNVQCANSGTYSTSSLEITGAVVYHLVFRYTKFHTEYIHTRYLAYVDYCEYRQIKDYVLGQPKSQVQLCTRYQLVLKYTQFHTYQVCAQSATGK